MKSEGLKSHAERHVFALNITTTKAQGFPLFHSALFAFSPYALNYLNIISLPTLPFNRPLLT